MIVDTNGDTINPGTPSKLVSSVPRHLPVELYGLIVQHITSVSVLCNLCTVSRAFLREAERILYHTIHLPGDFYCIYSWCKVIIGNPRLAILVGSLTLPWACDIPSWTTRIKFRVIVKQALSSLSRLSELDIYCSSPSRRYLTLETLHGHPFQLCVFENSLPNPRVPLDGWIKFFSQQPGIRHWTPNLPSQDIGKLLGAGLLPLLTSACIYLPVPGVLASRHIRALQINAKQCETLLNLLPAGLKMFERTLTRLSLKPSPTSQTKPLGFALEVLNIVSAVVPNLEFLGLESYTNLFHRCWADGKASFLSALACLPHLATLFLELPYWTAQTPDALREDYDSRRAEEEEALGLAKALMEANGSLRRVAFDYLGGVWAAGRYPCYIRMRSGSDPKDAGTAVFEGFNVMVPESWRHF